MSDFKSSKKIRNALEKDFPVPKSLKPENISELIKSCDEKPVRHTGVFSMAAALAACIAIVAVTAAAALRFAPQPDTDIYTDKSDKSVKTSTLPAVENDSEPADDERKLFDQIEQLKLNSQQHDQTYEDVNHPIQISGVSTRNDRLAAMESPEGSNGYALPSSLAADEYNIYYATSDNMLYVLRKDGSGDLITIAETNITGGQLVGQPQIILTGGSLFVAYTTKNSDTGYTTHLDGYNTTMFTRFAEYSQSGSLVDLRLVDFDFYLVTQSSLSEIELTTPDALSGQLPGYYYHYSGNEADLSESSNQYDINTRFCSSLTGECVTNIGVISSNFGESLSCRYLSIFGGDSVTAYFGRSGLYISTATYMGQGCRSELFSIVFQADPSDVKITGSFAFDGRITDSSCLNEYTNYLRVAATDDSDGMNKIYVLFCSGLELEGSTDGFGEGSYISGVKFDGDFAYVLTYGSDDPLFFDLSDPSQPYQVPTSVGAMPYLRMCTFPYGSDSLVSVGSDPNDPENGTLIYMYQQQENGSYLETARLSPGADIDTLTVDGGIYSDSRSGVIGFPCSEDGKPEYIFVRANSFSGMELETKVTFEGVHTEDVICKALNYDDTIYVFLSNVVKEVSLSSGSIEAEYTLD